MPQFTAQQIDQFSKVFSPGVKHFEIDRFLRLSTGDQLDDYVGNGVGKKEALHTVLNSLNSDYAIVPFLEVIYRETHFNQALRDEIRRLLPEIDGLSSTPKADFHLQKAGKAIQTNEGPGLQKIVKPSLFSVDAGTWFAKLGGILRQVCAITVDGAPKGSGFLVGPQAVLTNWHVLRAARAKGAGTTLACAFDFLRAPDGSLCAIEAVEVESVLLESPCSPAEDTNSPDDPPPQPDQLDFALLQLSRPLASRGYQKLLAGPPLAADAPLYIVQHANGQAMQIAQDSEGVIGFMHGGLRLRYHTNTQPGASGSPCFDAEWNLVALHHLGDPARTPPSYNQGIPSGVIRQAIETAGLAKVLGG